MCNVCTCLIHMFPSIAILRGTKDLMFAYLPQREAGQDDANDTDVEAMHDDGDDQEGECEDEHEIESGAEEDASPTDIPDGEKPEPATPVANGVPSGVDADGSCGPGPTEDVGPTLPPDYELPEWAQAPQSVSETDFAESGLQTLLLPHEQPELLEALHVEPHHLTANESSFLGKDSLDILRTNENFKHHILDNLAERLKAGVQPSGDECVEEVASSQDRHGQITCFHVGVHKFATCVLCNGCSIKKNIIYGCLD